MSAISSFVDALGALANTARVVANIGRPQLIKQLDVIRLTLEQFRQAADEDDVSKLRQLLEECETESNALEKRLFGGIDADTNKILSETLQRALHAKASITAKPPSARRTIRKTFDAKRAKLAETITTRNEREREELLAEIDRAIGKLRGISKSVENLSI
jgi:hypothetical protein